jgi:diguanylate cyclase (GGDEF)-like protein
VKNLYIDEQDIAVLLNSNMFRFVTRESVEGILTKCRIRTLRSGEVLLVSEEKNAYLYLIISGSVRIHLGSADSEPITFLGEGETVGEMSLIDGGTISAHVIANAPCRLIEIREELLWSLVQASHAAACNLLTILSQRLRHANRIIEERVTQYDNYRQFGSVDALTGLHNRHWFDQMLQRLLARCKMSGSPLSLIMADLDNFKEINDCYGHLAGDRAIYGVAQVIVSNCRPGILAARFGGDEFVIILPEIDAPTAINVAERLRSEVMVANILDHHGNVLPYLTLSIGIVQAVPDSSMEEVIAAADAALFRAKDGGRNRVSS